MRRETMSRGVGGRKRSPGQPPSAPRQRQKQLLGAALLALAVLVVDCRLAIAQVEPQIRYGERVPSEVSRMYERGLQYLVQTQDENGSWRSQCGVTGICVMALMASGEDPDFGPYASSVRKGVRFLIQRQDRSTGYLPGRMYDHGFGMLALAEAYGSVDDSLLWAGARNPESQPTIGAALELAVRRAVSSQEQNKFKAWRYSPESRDADTSVAGAVLMGLLAARNAGIEVPDSSIDGALDYFESCTSDSGAVGYSGGMGGFGESMNRSSIAALVFAVGKRKDSKAYQAALGYITDRLDHREQSYPAYFRYYMSQALFQGAPEAWARWNRETILQLAAEQHEDGSFPGNHGEAYGTGMALLALALNYRFLPIYER